MLRPDIALYLPCWLSQLNWGVVDVGVYYRGQLLLSHRVNNFDGPDVTLLVCFVTRHFSPFFLLKWVRWATAAIYVFLTSLPPYILQDRLAAIWVKNSLMVWYLLCLLCQNYQLLSHNFTSNLFAQSTSRLCRGVRNMQNAIMFKERQIIKFGFVMELKVSLKISYVVNQGSGHIWTIYLQFNEARSNWYR